MAYWPSFHVKLCKGVSNEGQYHVVMNYDVHIAFLYYINEVSAALLAPALIA